MMSVSGWIFVVWTLVYGYILYSGSMLPNRILEVVKVMAQNWFELGHLRKPI